MQQLSITTLFLFLLLLLAGCDDEQVLPNLDEAEGPSELTLNFAIAADNSGMVTIQPGGRGVTGFRVNFGDGTEEVAELTPGETVNHVYPQGTYTVTLEGLGINGQSVAYTQELSVDFVPPENLLVTVTGTPGNPLSVDVTATADLENDFAVYFGEDDEADPVIFTEGETVSYQYAEVGTYTIRVVARNGGSDVIEVTETVTISNPLLLPITFEQTSLNYAFTSFGGATSEVIDNPDPSGVNTSARVGRSNKQAGSETFAGSFLTLGEPIDFMGLTQMKVKVWSPRADIPVLLKLENLTEGSIFIEATLNNTVANQWEELTFDLSAGDLTADYQKVVIFFDFGAAGLDENFYFDDFELTDGIPELTLPLGFEEGPEYVFTSFGRSSMQVVDNPDTDGNDSDRVAAFTKDAGSETFAGAFIDLDEPIDFASSTTIRMRVWSPIAGAPILLKIEDISNSDNFLEVIVPTTVANSWEELTFDFSAINQSNDYARLVFFGNFGAAGTGEVYYFDDVRLD